MDEADERQLLLVLRDLQQVADRVAKTLEPAIAGPFEISSDQTALLERWLNEGWKSVQFTLDRENGSNGLSVIVVSLREP